MTTDRYHRASQINEGKFRRAEKSRILAEQEWAMRARVAEKHPHLAELPSAELMKALKAINQA